MATYYRSGVETFAIIGEESERAGLKGTIPDGSTFFAVDQNKYYTYYDGTWYETMPEAARLYHDDVGTDTKPIKLVGGVATVVANELAEDSKVVHNTGDETIAGTKTFTSDPVLMKQDPGIELRSSSSSATTGWRGHIAVKDDNGATNLAQVAFAPSASGYTVMQLEVWKPDRSERFVLEYRSYPDHPLLRGTSYLPTDSGGNPVAVESSGYMTSGMIAVDPRLVHTTGNEVVAGTKEFSNTIVNANSLDNRLIDMLGWTSQTENWWPTYTMAAKSYAKGTMVHILDVSNNLYGVFLFMGYSTNVLAFRYLGNFPVSRVRMARKGTTMTVLVSTQTSYNRLQMWCSQDIQSLTGTPHPNAPVLVRVTDRVAGPEPVVGSDWDAVITPTER